LGGVPYWVPAIFLLAALRAFASISLCSPSSPSLSPPQAVLSNSSNGAYQSVFNAQDIVLTTASAAQAVDALATLSSPIIVSRDEAIASGLALIYLATRAKVGPEEAIRLGHVLQLPAFNYQNIAQWVYTSIQDISTGSTESFIFKQLFDPKSSTFTYILADSATKDGIIIDPVYEQVERDLKIVQELELNVLYALNTHCHADHVTGTGKLKQSLSNLKSGISAMSQAKADILFKNGDQFLFGRHTLTVISTPGHTDGCVCFFTESNGGCIFTGDALLIRGCGRTDFQQGCATNLFESVHNNIFSLDPTTSVYPAHDYRHRSKSSVIEEKLLNPRLTKSKEQFVKLMGELGLPYPKMIDVAQPANMVCGVYEPNTPPKNT
jgi:sulfur dioxygenase